MEAKISLYQIVRTKTGINFLISLSLGEKD